MPGTNTVGTNTAARMMAIPITGADTSSIALKAAALGANPSSIWRCTASTTTMASSTTSPIASTSPNNESVLMENPNSGNMANVPTSETGTANSGISVARQSCGNRYVTSATSNNASPSVTAISLMTYLFL